jgi:ABC-type transport system substrate-binding protein
VTRRERAVVGLLVGLLALASGASLVPGLLTSPPSPTPSPSALATPAPSTLEVGIVGVASGVDPLTARNPVERFLVGLTFRGLLALGPGGSLVPDLAAGWWADPRGQVYTVRLRSGARWSDGAPVDAQDVVYTIGALANAALSGVSPTPWQDVQVEALDPLTVRFTLPTPLGGFPQALTQPIAPAHALASIPMDRLSGDPAGRLPPQSGPFQVAELSGDGAVLVPLVGSLAPVATGGGSGPEGGSLQPQGGTAGISGGAPGSSAVGSGPAGLRGGLAAIASEGGGGAVPNPLAGLPAPSPRSLWPVPYLDRIAVHFVANATALVAAFRSGSVAMALGLPASEAAGLAANADTRLLRDPGTTLTTVLLNLRPDHRAFRDSRVRTALLEAIDRDGMVRDLLAGMGARADGPIPPASWAFDPTKNPAVSFDPQAAAKLLTDAGWRRSNGGWIPAGGRQPLRIELLSPDWSTSSLLYAAAERVAAGWRALGIDVVHTGLPAAALVAGRLRPGAFDAAVVDVNIGLDPDLFPLLASSQILSGGLNLAGVQDRHLDQLLVAARSPGSDAARRRAYGSLQEYLAGARYLLTLFVRDEVVVYRSTLDGLEERQVAGLGDLPWDVLTWRLATDR